MAFASLRVRLGMFLIFRYPNHIRSTTRLLKAMIPCALLAVHNLSGADEGDIL